MNDYNKLKSYTGSSLMTAVKRSQCWFDWLIWLAANNILCVPEKMPRFYLTESLPDWTEFWFSLAYNLRRYSAIQCLHNFPNCLIWSCNLPHCYTMWMKFNALTSLRSFRYVVKMMQFWLNTLRFLIMQQN